MPTRRPVAFLEEPLILLNGYKRIEAICIRASEFHPAPALAGLAWQQADRCFYSVSNKRCIVVIALTCLFRVVSLGVLVLLFMNCPVSIVWDIPLAVL